MEKEGFEYILEKVSWENKSQIILNTFSLKEVVSEIKKLNLKSRMELYIENQWFPYARVVAIKPSGKIKHIRYNLEKLL
jgi:hypothetical protein